MSAQPYKTWRLFDCSADAIAFRGEHGTGGWIFVISDSDEAVLFPWQMTPKDIFESVFVAHREGWLIGADNKRRPDREMRDLPNATPLLGRIVRRSPQATAK